MGVVTLREARLRRKLTQEQLESKSGVDQTTISDLETGRTKQPDETTLKRLAKALGIAPSKLRFAAPSSDAISTRDGDRAGHNVPDTRTA